MRIVAIDPKPTPRRALPGRWTRGRSATCGGATAACFALAMLLGGSALSAQQTPPDFAAWLGAQDAVGLHRGLPAALAEVPAAAMRDALVAIAGSLAGPAWGSLTEQQHKELMDALAVQLATQSDAFRGWFGAKAAESSVPRGRFDLALTDLDRVEEGLLNDPRTKESRGLMRLDCLIGLERLAEAEQESARQLGSRPSATTHAALLNHAAQVQLLLGRFEHARVRLREASAKVDELEALDHPDWRTRRLEWLLAQLVLDLTSGDEESLQQALTSCRNLLAGGGRKLTSETAAMLQAAAAFASVLLAENSLLRVPPPLAELQAALRLPLEPRLASLLRSHLARLLLRQGQVEAAEQEIHRLAAGAGQRSFDLNVLESIYARATGADAAVLDALEARLLADLDQMLTRWRAVPVSVEGTGYLAVGPRLMVLGELIELTTQRHGAARAMQHMLQVQQCTSLSRARRAPAVDLSQIRRDLLGPGHGALVYVLAWGTSYVFAIGHDEGQLLLIRLPSGSTLHSLARDLRRELDGLCQGDSSVVEPLRTASRRAREALLPADLGPLIASWHRITIVGAQGIEGVPFEALELADGRLFGEAFAVDNVESLPLQLVLRTEAAPTAPPRRSSVRCLTNLEPSADFVAATPIEPGGQLGAAWEQLQQMLPPDGRILTGRDATREAFLASSRAGPWDLTIVLGHGRPPALNLPAALALAPTDAVDDGVLSSHDILSVPQSGVILLAVCHGTMGPARVGDDATTSSLAGAFLHGGARAVVGSDYPLRLSLHEGIGAEITAGLAQGLDLAEATRRARSRWSAGQPQRAYLASLIRVHGDGGTHVSLTQKAGTGPVWALAAVTTAVVLGLLARLLHSRATAGSRRGAAGQY